MPELVTLTEDGPLGRAGDQVWVDDPKDVTGSSKTPPAKKTAPAKKTTTRSTK